MLSFVNMLTDPKSLALGWLGKRSFNISKNTLAHKVSFRWPERREARNDL